MSACPVAHPRLGRCTVTGPHGGADRPHRYAAQPTADAGCADCSRPVLAASDAGPRGAACGCDYTSRCERHTAHPSAPMYHRGCARRTLRRRLERIAAR